MTLALAGLGLNDDQLCRIEAHLFAALQKQSGHPQNITWQVCNALHASAAASTSAAL